MKSVQLVITRHNRESETSSVQITDETLISLLRMAGIGVPDTADVSVDGFVITALSPIEVSWSQTLSENKSSNRKSFPITGEIST